MKRFTLGYAALAMLLAGAAQADVVISGDPTSNMRCPAKRCTASKPNAVFNVSDLQTMLAASNATIESAGGATNIVLQAPLAWTSAYILTPQGQV